MGKKRNRLGAAWLMLGAFCALFTAGNITLGKNAASAAWLLLEAWVLAIDCALIFKYKLPSKKNIAAACVLGGLVLASYADVFFVTGGKSAFSLVFSPLLTLLSGLAAFRVFEVFPEGALPLFAGTGKRSVCASVALGLAAGAVWGALNYVLMRGNQPSALNITPHCFLTALSPAVLEELALRTVFYALCVSLMRGRERTRFEAFTCYTMMILPHVLVHTPEAFRGGLINGLVTTALYVVIFGAIFAVLQKKRDAASAMIAHGVVDAIRFCFFGLPY